MITYDERAGTFRALHDGPGAFILPNPWDIGTARLLADAGFRALATTSAGFAFALGRPDGSVTREEALGHCRAMVTATDLPVSADLENGFADDPGGVAEMIRAAAATGLAGCSIEDFTGRPDDPIYPFEQAVERVAAAVEAARDLPRDFVLTARCENFLHGRADLEATIARLQAFEAAGADVLYAPGLTDLESIREVCAALTRPVNVLMGLPGLDFGVDELSDAGVRRISTGSALSRLALAAVERAAREMLERGTFTFTGDIARSGDVVAAFTRGSPSSA